MTVRILNGDCLDVLRTLPEASVHCVVTSPPYWGLRDYGHAGQIGLEATPAEYVEKLVAVFREVRRVLRDDGTLWLNLGDSYVASACGVKEGGVSQSSGLHGATQTKYRETLESGHGHAADKTRFGLRPKNLVGIPWRVAFALQADGWYLRQDIIWSKPNPMPESVRDRCTKAHEYLFLLAKSERYYFDADAIAEQVSDTSLSRWSQPTLKQQAGSDRVPGKTIGSMKAVGGPVRAQAQRAVELAREAGLTEAHIAAIRSCGITDSGKARETQDGCGNNDPAVQALADEAKRALGGYYREFLIAEKRNKRSVWTVTTQPFKEAHFATFPPALIEPCVLAGCPEKCCPHCGAPWEPIVERIDSGYDGSKYGERKLAAGGGALTGGTAKSTLGSSNGKLVGKREIKGYAQSCECTELAPVPGTVLDPFGGAGTTGLVADRMQRDAILIELNPAYAAMAQRRIKTESPLFADVV